MDAHSATPETSSREVSGGARAIALLGGAQALLLLGGLVRGKITAVYLGPEGVGLAGVIDQVAMVVLQLGSLNIPTIAVRFLAIARSGGGAAFGRLYRSFVVTLLAGCIAASACAAAIFLVRPTLVSAELVPERVVLLIALGIVPFTGAVNLMRSALSTLDRLLDVARVMVASALLTAVAALVGIRTGGLLGLYVATFIATLTIAIVLHTIIVRDGRVDMSSGTSLIDSLREHPDAVRYAAALYAVGIALPLSYSAVRASVLDSRGAEAAGYLAAAYTIATGARLIFTHASVQFLMPRASRAAPKEVRAQEVGSYLHTLTAAMAIAALPVALFPHEVLSVLFSSRFSAAVSFLGLFLMAELMMAFGDAYRTLLMGFNDLVGYVACTLAAPLGVMAGVVLVVPRYGIVGAGWVQIGAAVVALAISLARLKSRHNTSPDRRALVHYGVMIAMIGAATAAGQFSVGSPLVLYLGKVVFGLFLAVVAIALVPAAERQSLTRFLPFSRQLAAKIRRGR